MKIVKDKLHYRIQDYSFNGEVPKSLCWYVHGIWLAILLAPWRVIRNAAVAVNTAIQSRIGLDYSEDRNIGTGILPVGVAVAFWTAILSLLIPAGVVSEVFGNLTLLIVALGIFFTGIVIAAAIAVGLLTAVALLLIALGDKLFMTESIEKSVAAQWIIAKKQKICPTIEFVDPE